MENPTLEKPKPKTVNDIIHGGVQGFLNKNKNISVRDLLTKQGRKNAGDQLKTTFKSSALDTAQNAINYLRKEDIAQFDKLVKTIRSTPDLSPKKKINCLKIAGKVRGMNTCEEVSRRNKPSNIKKKKTLDAALEKLKNKRSSYKEDFEGVLRKDDPVRRTPGKTITTKAKTTGYEKGDLPASKKKKQLPQSTSSAIVKTDKKDSPTNTKRTPKPYSDRKKGGPLSTDTSPGDKKRKDAQDDRDNARKKLKNTAKNVAKSLIDKRKAVGALGGAYGTSTFNDLS